MGTASLFLLRAGLLAGPTIIAFDSGGYFPRSTAWAGIAAWGLAALGAMAVRPVLPSSAAGRWALAGLAGLCGWILLSRTWAPLAGPAANDAERAILYLGVLLGGAVAWRTRAAARAAEPALALGILVVVGYGLVGRLLPGIVHLHRSTSAGGRLEQPLTYWNGMGALAAMGVVLCARLAGDVTRPVRLRAAAAAAVPALGTGLYETFSRGALLTVAAGLLALIALAPSWPQARAVVIGVEGGVLAAALSSLFGGVEALSGSLSSREAQGAAMLVILVVLGATAAAAQRWACREEAAGRTPAGRLPLPRRAPALVVLVVVALLAAPLVAAAVESSTRTPAFGATASRFGSAGSNRYAYWRVALRTFADHPLRGVGASGFRVDWLEHRKIEDVVRDAHSLYLETAAELGLVGLALLATFLGGVAAAARTLWRRAPTLAAGPGAAALVWALHAGLDWDWELPGVTLVALVLAGLLIGVEDVPGNADVEAALIRAARQA